MAAFEETWVWYVEQATLAVCGPSLDILLTHGIVARDDDPSVQVAWEGLVASLDGRMPPDRTRERFLCDVQEHIDLVRKRFRDIL